MHELIFVHVLSDMQSVNRVIVMLFALNDVCSHFLAEGAQDKVPIYETLKAYLALDLDLDLDSNRCQSKTQWRQCRWPTCWHCQTLTIAPSSSHGSNLNCTQVYLFTFELHCKLCVTFIFYQWHLTVSLLQAVFMFSKLMIYSHSESSLPYPIDFCLSFFFFSNTQQFVLDKCIIFLCSNYLRWRAKISPLLLQGARSPRVFSCFFPPIDLISSLLFLCREREGCRGEEGEAVTEEASQTGDQRRQDGEQSPGESTPPLLSGLFSSRNAKTIFISVSHILLLLKSASLI